MEKNIKNVAWTNFRHNIGNNNMKEINEYNKWKDWHKIYGLYGSKGVGKNYIASIMKNCLENTWTSPKVELMALADPIKKFVIDILGIPRNLVYGSDEDKNTITNYDWEKIPVPHSNVGKMTVRQILQIVGTEFGRNVWGTQIWTNNLRNRIYDFFKSCQENHAYVIVTDVRFDSEVEEIKSWGGKLWVIDGPQRINNMALNDVHESEKQNRLINYDAIIKNGLDMSIDGIREQIIQEFLKDKCST